MQENCYYQDFREIRHLSAQSMKEIFDMDDMLHRLFSGSIYPAEMRELDTPEYEAAEKRYYSARDAFEAKLPTELIDEFEELKNIDIDFRYENDYNCFRKGFIIGMRLTIEGIRNSIE